MAFTQRVDPYASQPQREVTEDSSVISLPAVDQASAEVIRWQLECDRQLLDIEKRLGGFERTWNSKRQDYEYVKVHDALLNDKGISRIMGVLYTVMNVNTILSDYKKEEAYAVVRHVSGTVIDILRMNRAAFGINKSDLPIVIAIVENGVKPTLFRAVDAVTMDYLRGNIQTRTLMVQNPQHSGLLGKLRGFFK